MKTDASKLTGTPETLTIPLLGRALENRKSAGILRDPKSDEIVEKLNYDFSKYNDPASQRSLLRTTIRTAIIDSILRPFLKDNPEATVVEIGCGLNTRYERVDNGSVTWFDLDVPQVHEVWKAFFAETNRRKFLPYSAFDESWIEIVKSHGKSPFIFIAEASVIYFEEEKVRELFMRLSRHFPGGHYIFDSATPQFLKQLEANNDALKYCSARMKWTLADIQLLNTWVPTLEVLKTIDLENPPAAYRSFYPSDFRSDAEGYQLNWAKW